jgi:hypothetical protein
VAPVSAASLSVGVLLSGSSPLSGRRGSEERNTLFFIVKAEDQSGNKRQAIAMHKFKTEGKKEKSYRGRRVVLVKGVDTTDDRDIIGCREFG